MINKNFNTSISPPFYGGKQRIVLKIVCLLTLMVMSGSNKISAQTGVLKVFSNENLYTFAQDTLTIFIDSVLCDGNMNSASGSTVMFYGKNWTAASTSTYGGTGKLHFKGSRPSPYASSHTQFISGGYNSSTQTGCTFPNITKDNSQVLWLSLTDLKVRDTFRFIQGHVNLDSRDFTLGNNYPGILLGYSQNSYFYAPNGPTLTKGYLIRESIGSTNGVVDFPIAYTGGGYTPAAIKNDGTTDRFFARVFGNVYADGTSGTSVNDLGIARTWDIKEGTSGGSDVTLYLQHNTATNGANYDNTKAFISHFVGTAPNTSGDTTSLTKWDLVTYNNLQAGSGTGTITTGSAITGASVLSRSGISSFSPFTKSGYNNANPLPVDLINFNAQWQQNDGLVKWATATELNNSHFEVWRSFDADKYELIGSVNSLGKDGNSNRMLYYSFIDMNVANATTKEVYYQLIQYDFDGSKANHGVVVLDQNKVKELTKVNVYPNPTKGEITVSASGFKKGMVSMKLSDVAGRVVTQNEMDIDGFVFESINMADLNHGIYFLEITDGVSKKSVRVIKSN